MKKRIRLDGNKPSEKGLKFLEFILSVVKGQDKAVKSLADAIEDFESEMPEEKKPIFIGLCCGPSGVGKTLTAELLAEYWFGNRRAFTKINCAEFSESHRVSELKGSPAGYVGHWDPNNKRDSGTPPILWQGNIDRFAMDRDPKLIKLSNDFQSGIDELGMLNAELADKLSELSELFNDKGLIDPSALPYLVNKMQEAFPAIDEREVLVKEIQKIGTMQAFSATKRPKSIILFDEIEKAHPDFHKLLLGIMDKAEFQLANGLVTDFSNSVILMTSNVGSHKIAELLNPKGKIGFVQNNTGEKDSAVLDKEIYTQTVEELKRVFSPEFVGRIEKVNVYRPLTSEILRQIVDVELREFQKGILKSFPISLIFDERVREFILREALDKPEQGVRLLKKKIRKYIRKPLCRLKNNGDIEVKDIIHVLLEEKNGKTCIVFEKEPLEDTENKA